MQRIAVALNSLSTQSIAILVLTMGCAMFVFSVLAKVEPTFAAGFCTGLTGLARGILTGHTLSKTQTSEAGNGQPSQTSQTTEPAQANFPQGSSRV